MFSACYFSEQVHVVFGISECWLLVAIACEHWCERRLDLMSIIEFILSHSSWGGSFNVTSNSWSHMTFSSSSKCITVFLQTQLRHTEKTYFLIPIQVFICCFFSSLILLLRRKTQSPYFSFLQTILFLLL